MADDSMLGLFDADGPSFLDELTTPSNATGSGMMMGIEQNINTGMQPQMMGHMPQQPQQTNATYHTPQMAAMQGQAMTQALHHYDDSYSQQSQYGSPMHPPPQPNMVSPTQQQQFRSPPPGQGHVQSPPSGYQQYTMHNTVNRMPSPQQQQQHQQGMAQMGGMMPQNQPMWNQSQQVSRMGPQSPYLQQTPQNQQQLSQHQVSTYLSQHHDYALPSNNTGQPASQRLSHYPPQQQQLSPAAQNNYGIVSPPGNTGHLTHMPPSSPNNVVMNRSQAPNMGGFPSSSSSQSMNMAAYKAQQTQPLGHPGFPDDHMQGPTLNSGSQMSGTLQHYPYSNQQQKPQSMMQSGIKEAPPLSHYPSTSSQNAQYMSGYSGLPQQRPNASPRPPPSLTPTTPTQGSFPQSSLQQLEQLVPPKNAPQPHGNSTMYQPHVAQQKVGMTSPPGMGVGQPQSVPQGYNMMGARTSQTHMSTAGPVINTSMANHNGAAAPLGQMSPSVGMGAQGKGMTTPQLPGQGLSNHHAVNMEISQLQAQIQQLYAMPQTPQTQQNMLDLQERVRSLKAQQQTQLLQQRQQQQHMQQQQQQQQHMLPQQQPHLQQQQHPISKPQIPQQQMQPTPKISPQAQKTPQQAPPPHLQPASQPPHLPVNVASSTLQQQQPLQQKQQVGVMGMTSPPALQGVASVVPPPGATTQIHPVPTPKQPLQQQPVLHQQQMQQKPVVSQQPVHIQIIKQVDTTKTQMVGSTPQQQQTPQQAQPQKVTIVTLSQPPTAAAPKTTHIAIAPQPTPKQPQIAMAPSTTQHKIQLQTVPAQSQVVPIQVVTIQPATQATATTVLTAPTETTTTTAPVKEKPGRMSKAQQQQEKANRIVAEAIAKAQAQGKDVPSVVNNGPEDGLLPDEEDEEEPAAEKATKKKKKTTSPKPKAEKKPKEKKPKVVKPKPKPKKKIPASFLKTKKRKRGNSSDGSDIEVQITPPASPPDDDSIQKRRSGRHTKRKKYLDDLDLQLSDDNQEIDVEGGVEGAAAVNMKPVQFFVENPAEEDAQVVEKILGMRTRKRPVPKINVSEENEEVNTEEPEEVEVEEFFVKYKNFSYLHCEWKTAEELERDKRIHMKIKRYKMKRLQQNNYFTELDEDELFNPEYVEVDRVLEVSVILDPVTEEEVTHYLVKWRVLPYEEATWELSQDVDQKKVEEFSKIREPPPEDEREPKALPKASEWKALEKTHNYKNNNQLREYQLEGVNWLTFCWYNRQNCILADEMGLGKTVQSITFLQEIVNYGINGPFLVVAPLSTIGNWQREFETWTDMNAITYHGSSASRNMIQEYEMYYKDENGYRIPDLYKFHALITTYEIIISDCEMLSQINWCATVIDEAHRLKNKNCKLLEGLKLLDFDHRVLLTGTPLQNNVEELFSLLNFLDPQRFSSSESFMADFGNLKTESQVDKLKDLLKPMMLRRLKEDVEKNLAPKEETIIEVELTNIQKKYYRAILERNFSFLSKGSTGNSNVPNLMNTVMELRKCCNHPFLINGAEEKILEEAKMVHGAEPEKLFGAMIQSSGKLVLIDKLLPKLKANNHKVLIFSQMIRVLDIIEDYLVHKRYLYERLDGRIRGSVRQEAIDRFSKPDSDRFAFLLCTRAGGLGINLTAADTVIIYDSDWNPQNDLQAQARCHRIGQQKHVKVYRLITRNSYEREMFDRASLKLGLDKAVLQNINKDVNAAQQQQMSKKEVEDLLKRGAYGAIMDDDTAADEFCEEDIDQILQRRTQIIQIESEGKGSTFSKASFSATGNRSDIDIDDPNFWQMWAKKADLDLDHLNGKNELIIEEPRRRKQTARYGNEDGIELSDLTSSSDTDDESGSSKTKKGRELEKGQRKRGRRRKGEDGDNDFEADLEDNPGIYSRSECFKVEKNLLVYGWGRWQDILLHGRFKRKLSVEDVQIISRAMLIYSLNYYKGDERIKGFIYDLVTPAQDGQQKDYSGHSGLSAPVPRGRKGKKAKLEKKNLGASLEQELALKEMEANSILTDDGYKKHLQRHSNKVLLRVRLLYYLKQEVIGDQDLKVFSNIPVTHIDIPPPYADGEPPTAWWDEDADKSLLIGVFKHGYEKYNAMRQDPCLSFLCRCGPPDNRALLAEQNDDDDNDKDDLELGADPEFKPARLMDDEDLSPASPASEAPPILQAAPGFEGKLAFPSPSDLNTRLRRVITSYQRNHKKQQLKIAQRAKKMEKRERFELIAREKEMRKREAQQSRWSRREEADFYRTVSTYGVEYIKEVGCYNWNTFRVIARLDKKFGDTLTEYYLAFRHMCKRVCKKFNDESEAIPPNNLYVEPITEERASRCLARIDLLNKIREDILPHPKLDEHLKLCQPGYEVPDWWECGRHDKDLLLGAARHGLSRTDYHILHDPGLSFKEVVKAKKAQSKLSPNPAALTNPAAISSSDAAQNVISSQSEMTPKKEAKMEPSETSTEDANQTSPAASPVKMEGKEESVKTEGDESKPEIKQEEQKEDDKDIKPEVKDVKVEESEVKEEVKESEVKEEAAEVTEKEAKVKEESSDEVVKEEVKEETKDVEMKEEKDEEKTTVKEEEVKAEVKGETEEKSDVKEERTGVDSVKDEEMMDEEMREDEEDSMLRPEMRYLGDESGYGYELDSNEPTVAELLARSMSNPVQWPKDKAIFHRLEQVCYCVEKGEWPFHRRHSHLLSTQAFSDSRASTPMDGTFSSKPDTPLTDYNGIDSEPQTPGGGYKVMKDDGDDDDGSDGADVTMRVSEGDGLKLTFQKKRKRRKKAEIEAERARFKELLGIANQNLMSSDAESESNLSSAHGLHESYMNGNGLDMSPMRRTEDDSSMSPFARRLLPDGDGLIKKKRGRKRKVDKLAEQALAEAVAMRNKSMWAAGNMDMDSHVSVINLEDGSRLSGDEAPLRKDLNRWLDEHPGYMVDRPEIDDDILTTESIDGRRKRRPRVDPAKLDMSQITGEENVSVINRETGKKITGAKAPPLKHLAEWLQQNPAYDIDGKWGPLVKEKGNLPDKLKNRIHASMGKRRGRPPSIMTSSMVGSDYGYPAASSMSALSGLATSGMMAGLKMPFGMPFGSMPGLGINPMFNLAGFGLMGAAAAAAAGTSSLPSASKSVSDSVGKEESSSSSSKKDGKSPAKASPKSSSKSSSSNPTTPHPSFPFIYNPLLYNPLFAQSLGNFNLPTNIPTSFASLAQAGVLNGLPRGAAAAAGAVDSEEDESCRPKSSDVHDQEIAQDLSMKKATNLSTKKKDRHERKHKHKSRHSSSSSAMSVLRQQMEDNDQPVDLCSKKPKPPPAEEPAKAGSEPASDPLDLKVSNPTTAQSKASDNTRNVDKSSKTVLDSNDDDNDSAAVSNSAKPKKGEGNSSPVEDPTEIHTDTEDAPATSRSSPSPTKPAHDSDKESTKATAVVDKASPEKESDTAKNTPTVSETGSVEKEANQAMDLSEQSS